MTSAGFEYDGKNVSELTSRYDAVGYGVQIYDDDFIIDDFIVSAGNS